VHRGHALPLGVERERGDTRPCPAHVLHQRGVERGEEGDVQRVSDRRVALRVVAQRGDLGHPPCGLGVEIGGGPPRVAGQGHGLQAQAVLRDRAGLVGEDHRGGPERLHGREPPHDRAAAGHPPDPERQRDGDDRGEPLGHRRHGQRDGRQERALEPRLRDPGSQQGEPEHRHGDEDRDSPQAGGEAGQLALHRRRRLASPELRGDRSELRGRTRGRDHAIGGSARHERPGEGPGLAILPAVQGGALGDRQRLAREQRLVHRDRGHPEQPDIGRDAVARGERHDVARNHLARRQGHRGAVSDHPRPGSLERPERLQSPGGLPRLENADDRVEDHDGQDRRCVLGLPEPEPGHRGRRHQQYGQGLPQLADRAHHQAVPVGRRHLVRPEALEPVGRLGRGEPSIPTQGPLVGPPGAGWDRVTIAGNPVQRCSPGGARMAWAEQPSPEGSGAPETLVHRPSMAAPFSQRFLCKHRGRG